MLALGFNVNKSLQELEGSLWGKPEHGDTGLVKTCYRLHRVPVKDLTPGDLRIMIGQQIGLDFLVPLALRHLEPNPLVEGNFYPGDLLVNVLAVDSDFWRKHAELQGKAIQVAENAMTLFPSRPDIADKTVTRSVSCAYAEFQKRMKLAY